MALRRPGVRSMVGARRAVPFATLLVACTLAAVAAGCGSPVPSATPSASASASVPAPASESTTASLSPPAFSLPSGSIQASPSISPSASASRPGLPDRLLTPGAINPAVTPATLSRTICKAGWTATVRPSTSYTNKLKIQQIAAYRYVDTDPHDYEEDHLISLELGGAPRDPRNLWPEPHTATAPDGTAVGSGAKDRVENLLRRRVCAGTMTLADAQRGIATDWVSLWIQLGSP